MKTSETGINLIKNFESLHDGDFTKIGLQPKLCPAGLWTEGYGRLVLDDRGNRISGQKNKDLAYKFSKIHTEHEAVTALAEDLKEREDMINSLKLPVNQNQFDALVSFAYNIGFANLKNSTLFRKAKVNISDPAIANEFAKWNKATINGKKVVLNGLTRRRKAESDLYFKQ